MFRDVKGTSAILEILSIIFYIFLYTLLYSFNENSFHVGEVRSYTEIKFDMTFKIKQKGLAAIDIELNYFVKDKSNKTTSRVFDGQL